MIGDFRDRAWGHDVKEPDWADLFDDPGERHDAVQAAIEQQKELIAKQRAARGGKIGRSSS